METAFIKSGSQEKTKTESKKMTYQEFLELCDEDTLAEWEDGEIIMVPSASERHQDITVFLTVLLRLYVDSRKLGKLYNAPYQITDSPSVFKGYKNDICLNDKYVRNS